MITTSDNCNYREQEFSGQVKKSFRKRRFQMSGQGILENIISDIVFIILAIFLSWLLTYYTGRRKLQTFFHTLKSKRLVIYLSNLRVLPFGAIGISGKKMSYDGSAVPYGEMQVASEIQNLFSFIIPKLVEISQYIGFLLLSDVKVQIKVSPSPMGESKVDSEASIISLGSSAYNVVSANIEKLDKNIVHFKFGSTTLKEIQETKNNQLIPSGSFPTGSYSDSDPSDYDKPTNMSTAVSVEVVIPSLYSGGTVSQAGITNNMESKSKAQKETESAILIDGLPPITDLNYGFIEKIKDKNGRYYFYVAGLSELATKSAASYLWAKWFSLDKKYEDGKSFLIMLRFDNWETDNYTIIFERELL